MGLLNKATDTAPYHAAQDQDRRAEGRSALPFHVLGHAGRRHRWPTSSPRSSACPPRASRSRSSTSRACRPTSSRWWSRCSRGWCSTMRSGRATRCRGRSSSSARRRTATSRPTRPASGQAVRKILERIAKEGRKYGVSLGLITQRPSDLAEGVLSQCGTIIAMRLNNERDQAVRQDRPCRKARAASSTSSRRSRNRECIVCGEGVSIPIRVSFDDLERDRRPASSDPLFSELWRQTGDEEAMVARVVKRWRARDGNAESVIPAQAGNPRLSARVQKKRDPQLALRTTARVPFAPCSGLVPPAAAPAASCRAERRCQQAPQPSSGSWRARRRELGAADEA